MVNYGVMKIDTAMIMGKITIRQFIEGHSLASWLIQRVQDYGEDAVMSHGPYAIDGTYMMPKWITIA